METKELLELVAQKRLQESLDCEGSEENKGCFKEAMEATDRYIEVRKLEDAKKEQRIGRIIKCVEIAAVPVFLATLNYAFKKDLAREVMRFEKEDVFTSTPGRTAISSFFRFKD